MNSELITSATNKVMRVIKTAGAQTWAGTTISTANSSLQYG